MDGKQNGSSFEPGRSLAILMCTFNGARFLRDQLHSIERQTHKDWRLCVSDDGSRDDTLKILQEFAARHPEKVDIRAGPRQGATSNFLSLATDTRIEADYFAFCDQDDVWMHNHLFRRIEVLSRAAVNQPALIGGRTLLISEVGSTIGRSILFTREPRFQNAVLQSIAGGNTMVFNRAARQLVVAAKEATPVAHDWWLYQLVSGAGGQVHYDQVETVHYRQHSGNILGSNQGFSARLRRFHMLIQGRFSSWTNQNLAALRLAQHLITPENRAVIDDIVIMREGNIVERLSAFYRSGIYRQTVWGSLALAVAVLLRRV